MGPSAEQLFSDLDLSTGRRLIVASSGGSDSLALLLLLRDFLGEAAAPRLAAVTVDHRLRPESAQEADYVAALCGSLGVEHRIMVWEGAKPRTGLIAAARDARYALLAQAALDVGADMIFTGHTMDDQAETVAMRAERGAGGGLSGMARATLFEDSIWIVRTLLDIRRDALRDYLAGLGHRWIDDPTNENPAYERVRVRAQIAETGSVEALAAKARQVGRARSDLARLAAGIVDEYASRPSPGLFRLDPAMFAIGLPHRDAAIHALRAVLAVAGGAPHLPDATRARALFGRLCNGQPLRATLSRAVLDARRGGVWIMRETRGLSSTTLAGKPVIWDGRWRLAASADTRGLAIGPLGGAKAKEIAVQPSVAPQSLVRTALSSEPVLHSAGALLDLAYGQDAAVHGVLAIPVIAPFERFLPEFDLPLAGALRALVGAGPLPATPWKQHIGERA